MKYSTYHAHYHQCSSMAMLLGVGTLYVFYRALITKTKGSYSVKTYKHSTMDGSIIMTLKLTWVVKFTSPPH
jgi:hypothetical protein